jgi:hypothetical protein
MRAGTLKLAFLLVLIWLAMVFAGTAYAIGPGAHVGTTSRNPSVIIDTGTIINSNFKGFGVEWDPYEPAESSYWTTIYTRLDFMKLSFIRCMNYTQNYTQKDSSGAPLFKNGKPVYDWNTSTMKTAFNLLDYCKANNIQVTWGDWLDDTRPFGNLYWYTDPRWSQIVAGALDYLINTKGYTCIKYYNFGNEPNGWWTQNCPNLSAYKKSVGLVQTQLNNRGLLQKIKFSGPSAYGPNYTYDPADFYEWLNWVSSQIPKVFQSYDFHWYPNSWEVSWGCVRTSMQTKRATLNKMDPNGKYKDLFVLESGLNDYDTSQFWYGVTMADYAAQAMQVGVAGVSVWLLDNAMYCQNPSWGFWDSRTESGLEHIMPWFYPWSLLSRLFPRGSVIVSTGSDPASGVRVAAMKIPNGSNFDMTFVVANNSSSPVSLTLTVPSAQGPATLNQYNYFQDDMPTDENGLPKVETVLTNVNLSTGVPLNLTGLGVVFLSTLYGGTPVPLSN